MFRRLSFESSPSRKKDSNSCHSMEDKRVYYIKNCISSISLRKRYTTIISATAMFLLAVFSFTSMTAFAQGGANLTAGANMSVVPVQKTAILHVVPEHESAQQIRDEIRSNHPLLAAIADKIQTMDERETLKYTLGVEIVSDLLKMHAEDLIRNQTAR